MSEAKEPCEAVLQNLLQASPLPKAWRLAERFIDRAHIAQLDLQLVGVVGELLEGVEQGGAMARQVTGSAAGVDAEATASRAYYELLERVSVVEVQRHGESLPVCDIEGRSSHRIEPRTLLGEPLGSVQRLSYSNGVACGRDWPSACQSAWYELVERDAVLRSWYGQLRFERCPDEAQQLGPLSGVQPYYHVQAYWLEHCAAAVAFAVAWPLEQPRLAPPPSGLPLVYGAAARETRAEAVEAASRECAQRLGFLWGEALPEAPPEFAPDPAYHQEFFLVEAASARLRGWLQGEHARLGAELASGPAEVPIGSARFVDLTPPAARGLYVVVKAEHEALLPLVFGRGHPQCRRLPETLAVHPVA